MAVLRKLEKAFATLFRCHPVATVLAELDLSSGHRILDVNEAFEEVTGYSRDEVINQTPETLGFFVDADQYMAAAQRRRAEGRIDAVELDFRRKDGTIGTCLTSVRSVDFFGRPCHIVALVDISARKRTEQARVRSRTLSTSAAGREPVATVLVVEEDDFLLQAICDLLTERGYKALFAHSGQQAVALASACDSRIDLLVSVNEMASMSGQELAKSLRILYPSIKTLFLSSRQEAPAELSQEGALVISKPFPMTTLEEAIRKVLL